MRYILTIWLGAMAFLLTLPITVHAQDPHRHRDTIPFMNWQQEITRAPVLTGQEQPIIIVPNRGQYCFDKLLYLEMHIGRMNTEQCAYLDTHKGLTGILPPSRSGGAVTEIMPELENFNFSVTSLKGNVYVYKNHKSKDGIERDVFTGNTQTFQYQNPVSAGNASTGGLMRKSEVRGYCGNKITAHAYRYDGGMSTWYIYGDRYPEKLHTQKFLGAFGVGYMLCEEGLFLVMELEFGAGRYVRIGQMENVHSCFDPSEFKVMEDKFRTTQQEEIEHNRAKQNEEQAHINGDCVAEKQAVLDYKKAMTQKQEELLRKTQHGNSYQDTAVQRAYLSMMDPLDNVRMGILNTNLGICSARADMAKNPTHAREDQNRIACLNQQLALLQEAESKMMAYDNQYRSNPAVANAQKSKIYLDVMRNAPKCD